MAKALRPGASHAWQCPGHARECAAPGAAVCQGHTAGRRRWGHACGTSCSTLC